MLKVKKKTVQGEGGATAAVAYTLLSVKLGEQEAKTFYADEHWVKDLGMNTAVFK